MKIIGGELNKKAIVGFSLFACFFVANSVFGAAAYTTHENIPGQGTTNSFPEFLQFLYNFSIGAAAILAMIMIGVGAFVYIVTSAGNASKMANGKDMIFSAIYGLIIALVAYLALFLINPDLVTGNIQSIPTVEDCADGNCN